MIEYSEIEPFDNGSMTDQQIADAEWADRALDPDKYKPLSSRAVKRWLALNGLSERLALWLKQTEPASDIDLSDPATLQLLTIRGGVSNTLDLDPGEELDLSPGSETRQLLDAVVATPNVPVTDADRTAVITAAIGEPYTAEEVAESRADYQSLAARNAVRAHQAAADEAIEALSLQTWEDANAVRDAWIAAWNSHTP